MVTIYNTTLSATSQRHFSDGLGGGFWHLLLRAMLGVNLDTLIFFGFFCYMYYESFPNGGELVYVKFKI